MPVTRLPKLPPRAALPGRANPIPTADRHAVHGRPIKPPFPSGLDTAIFGLGRFWGAERVFWPLAGVYSTAVGYAGGITPNPTYAEVATGRTGHAEVVLVAYDPRRVSFTDLLKTFFESHDPTQGLRQGDDIGPQYRSVLYGSESQLAHARGVKTAYEPALQREGYDAITTEILPRPAFYYAEAEHQQYLAKIPTGYRGIEGTGVDCPVGRSIAAA